MGKKQDIIQLQIEYKAAREYLIKLKTMVADHEQAICELKDQWSEVFAVINYQNKLTDKMRLTIDALQISDNKRRR